MNQAFEPVPNRWGFEDLGVGVGLRRCHYRHVLEHRPQVDWFEVVSENFLDAEGWSLRVLEEVAQNYPVVLHGVSMSLGSSDPLDRDYLARLRLLAGRIGARWIGDHVCWTGVAGWNSHELLPIPYHERSLAHMVQRVREAQDCLERTLVLENASTYLGYQASTMSESRFLAELSEQADCGLLLDLNNVYVSCRNHDLDPWAYLEEIPLERVVQVHLAGHTDHGSHCLDTHSRPVIDAVWELYAQVHRRTGGRATLLEWDADIPSFEELHAEALKARRYRSRVQGSP